MKLPVETFMYKTLLKPKGKPSHHQCACPSPRVELPASPLYISRTSLVFGPVWSFRSSRRSSPPSSSYSLILNIQQQIQYACFDMDSLRALRHCFLRSNSHIFIWCCCATSRDEGSIRVLSNVGIKSSGWKEHGTSTCMQSQQRCYASCL